MALKRKFAQQTESLVAGVPSEAEVPTPARTVRKAPATGPGQMLAFQEELHASNEELETLRARVRAFESSLQVIKLEPSDIVVSKLGNRHESSYATPEFEALKTDIAASNGNVQPIKVRPIKGEANQFELIFGHRRHRACLELKIPVLAMVEAVDDVAMFLAMDRENREREDLSPYEQGMHYKRALELQIFPSLRRMAQALEVSHSSISKAVALADLPEEVIAAFRSPIEIQFRWGKEIADALRNDSGAVIARAQELASREMKPSGAMVTQLLCEGEKEAPVRTVRKLGKNGEVTLTQKDGTVTVAFAKDAINSKKVSQLAKLIEDLVAG